MRETWIRRGERREKIGKRTEGKGKEEEIETQGGKRRERGVKERPNEGKVRGESTLVGASEEPQVTRAREKERRGESGDQPRTQTPHYVPPKLSDLGLLK